MEPMRGSPRIKRCVKRVVYLPLAVGLLVGLTGVLNRLLSHEGMGGWCGRSRISIGRWTRYLFPLVSEE